MSFLQIDRKVGETVRIGGIHVRVIQIRTDVGNGLVTLRISDKDGNQVLDQHVYRLPIGDVIELGPDMDLEPLFLETSTNPETGKKTVNVRLGINAPRSVPIERDDMKEKPPNQTGFHPIAPGSAKK